MKKIISLLLIFVLYFSFINVKADNKYISTKNFDNIMIDKTENVDSEATTWIFIIGGLSIIGSGVYYYLKKRKKII